MIISRSIKLYWLFLLLSGGFFSCLANACPKTHCVRVGAWNVEWLGSDNRKLPVDQKTIAAMADLIANQLSIDVISLEEINTGLDGNIRGENYSLKPWQDLQRALESDGYQTQSGNSGGGQRIVLAWRAPVIQLQAAGDLPIPDEYSLNEYCHSSHLRKPLAGWFRANQFDFWIVGLHLKANGENSKCSSAVRIAQTKALLHALEPLSKKDPDVILVGDFNASSRNRSLQALTSNGFVALDDKQRRSPDSATHSYHGINTQHANAGSLIDHIMIRPATTNEWQTQSTVIYKPHDANLFANTFSDHVPLWADFYTMKDDD